MYFTGPWENILTLWQYLKFYYFNLPYLTNLEPPSLTLPAGHQMQPIAALKLNFQHVVPDGFFLKLPKFDKIKSGTAKVH